MLAVKVGEKALPGPSSAWLPFGPVCTRRAITGWAAQLLHHHSLVSDLCALPLCSQRCWTWLARRPQRRQNRSRAHPRGCCRRQRWVQCWILVALQLVCIAGLAGSLRAHAVPRHCLAGLLPVPDVRTSCRACGTEGRAPRLSLASPRGCWYQQRAPCDLLPLHAVAVNPPRLMNPHSSACASLGRGPAAAARTIPETVASLSQCAPPVDLCPQVDLAAACIAARAALAQGRDADAFKAAQAVSLGCIACAPVTVTQLLR